MRRLVVLLVIVSLVVALPLSHVAFAAKAAKVDICHVNSANDTLDFGSYGVTFGKVISVSENAVAAHEAHGDSTTFYDMDQDFRDLVEEIFGITLPNADCYFLVF